MVVLLPFLFLLITFLPRLGGQTARAPGEPGDTSPLAPLHDEWERMLRAHVGAEGVDDAGWAREDSTALGALVDALGAVETAGLPAPEILAWGINLHNASVVRARLACGGEAVVRAQGARIPASEFGRSLVKTHRDPRVHLKVLSMAKA